MKHHIFALACLVSAAAFVSAVPLPANDQELDVLQIPLANGKEIDVLTLGAKDQEQMIADRNKRTIGLLRELFPDITKEIDAIVNRIVAQVIRVVGPSLLPTLLNSNRPSTAKSDFDAGFDDDDDDEDDADKDDSDNDLSNNNVSPNVNIGTRVQLDLPTFAPEGSNSDDSTTNTRTTSTEANKR